MLPQLGAGSRAGHTHDGDRPVVECIERRQVAFARNAERVLDPVNDELVDQHFAAGPGAVIGAHGGNLPFGWSRKCE